MDKRITFDGPQIKLLSVLSTQKNKSFMYQQKKQNNQLKNRNNSKCVAMSCSNFQLSVNPEHFKTFYRVWKEII